MWKTAVKIDHNFPIATHNTGVNKRHILIFKVNSLPVHFMDILVTSINLDPLVIVRVSTEINKENETFTQKGRGEILVLTQRIETEGKGFF